MDTQDSDEEYAYVLVSGYGDYREITDRLKMEPWKAWNAGDKKPKGGEYPRTEWAFQSGLAKTEELTKHIDILLTLLEQRSYVIKDLQPDWEIHINCVGYYRSSQHGLHINKDIVKRAAYLGIEFDFDLYYVGQDN